MWVSDTTDPNKHHEVWHHTQEKKKGWLSPKKEDRQYLLNGWQADQMTEWLPIPLLNYLRENKIIPGMKHDEWNKQTKKKNKALRKNTAIKSIVSIRNAYIWNQHLVILLTQMHFKTSYIQKLYLQSHWRMEFLNDSPLLCSPVKFKIKLLLKTGQLIKYFCYATTDGERWTIISTIRCDV